MKETKTNSPLVFYAGLILLFFVLLSLNMTGGLYARYATDDGDSDGARTAVFEIVTAELDSFDDNPEHIIARISGLQPGMTRELTIPVSNQSEVAVKYSLKAENLTNNIPLKITVSGVNLAPNSSGAVTVMVEWPNDTDADKSAELAGKIDIIRIIFTAEQID